MNNGIYLVRASILIIVVIDFPKCIHNFPGLFASTTLLLYSKVMFCPLQTSEYFISIPNIPYLKYYIFTLVNFLLVYFNPAPAKAGRKWHTL